MIPVLDDEGHQIASIHIGYPRSVISVRTTGMIISSLRITMVVFLVGILLMILTLNHWIARPLARITAAIQDISQPGAGFGGQVPVASSDELGQLATAFNQMSTQLRVTTVSKDFMDSIIESMFNSLIVLAPDLTIVAVNPATQALLGYQDHELIGQPMRRVLVGQPGQPDILNKAGMKQLLDRGYVQDTEMNYIASDGHLCPVLFTSAVMRDPGGGVKGVVCVAQDITPLRDAQLMQLKLETQLRQAQKLQMIGTMAGGIAHNFNNLLVPIIGYTSMLHESAPDDSPDKHDLEIILQSANRAKSLVSQILVFGHRKEGARKPVELTSVIDDALRILRITMPTNIEIQTRHAKDIPCITGDETQLHQVFMNLFVNAQQAMPLGGWLTITVEPRRFHDHKPDFGNLMTGDYVSIGVQDTGCGISPEILPQIFDPFFTTKGPELGNGLGLATVLGIVDQHEGAIEVTSSLQEGTRFSLHFPIADSIPEPEAASPAPRGLLDEIAVLLVEDEKIVRDYYQCVLKSQGRRVDVVVAEDGRHALDMILIDPTRFDLIISDHMMPRMTGTQLLREIRAKGHAIPFLMITGYNERATDFELFQSDFESILTKPCLVEELLAEIYRLVKHSMQKS